MRRGKALELDQLLRRLIEEVREPDDDDLRERAEARKHPLQRAMEEAFGMSRTDDISVVRRPTQGRLEVHIPWREGGNRKVIKRICGTLTRPQWDGDRKRWVIARAHFTPLIGALKAEYGQVRVITAHCDAEKCDTRCREAEGAECVCSCGGQYHGGDEPPPAAGASVGTTALFRTGWTEREWIVSECMNAAEMHAWIVEEGGRLTGTQLPVPGAEEIFAGFIRRFGQLDATRIARAAIEVHRGMWIGAPVTPRRFTRSNDEFFARRVLAPLDRRAERTRAV